MEVGLLKIILAGVLFSSLFFVKEKYKWPVGLVLIAYLGALGAEII